MKMVIKCYSIDGSTRMVALEDLMTAHDLCVLLVSRFHNQAGPNWTIVEKLPDLHLGKIVLTPWK